ncbi:MAG: hypothetical protein ACYTBX_01635 [Planctomycetota bacterium]|jgi:hypothetical protein
MKPKNSLLMTDWVGGTGKIAKDFKTFIYELVLLSLVYDEILIQDEALVLSRKLSRWMKAKEDFRLLEECFGAGCIRVLTHPKRAFPIQELKDLSEYNPIQARAKYIAKYSTWGDKPFKPTKLQRQFYNRIDSLISSSQSYHRPVGQKERIDFRSRFPKILLEVLSGNSYRKWRERAFSGITPEMADEFIRYIDEPGRALGELPSDIRHSIPGEHIFTRSLGYRLTTLYEAPMQNAMKKLIETVFAAPFCENEDASGRYDSALKEFVLPLEESDYTDFSETEHIVSVQAHTEVPLTLPPLNANLSKVISETRETDAGQELRRVMKEYGPHTYAWQQQAWKAVANELSRRLTTKTKRVDVKIAAIKTLHDTCVGAVVGGLCAKLCTGEANPGFIAGAFLSASLSPASRYILEVLRFDLRCQELSPRIEKAVQIRCCRVLLPPSYQK